ncbi:hypothetical protein G4V62_06420 [Bacillaceae bacterium SIJ1]|uniref:type III-B CRISPR module-associated Cmr3 family protein n=1 Tax=Litoribacterium kuwaitense TaxID=1398745 RepID=UPI0013E9CB3B|nr:type III-B CRISPR module-associated Cmr3 family protein [Litoribacterium kuwaitense]NGP44608.1 hypothetical protein [Litoribacterium kuwaitense]
MGFYELTPIDHFFFKGHHVMEPGLDNVATGLFPPRTNTVYGAIRSTFIREMVGGPRPFVTFRDSKVGNDQEWRSWLGTKETLGHLSLNQFGVLKTNTQGQKELLVPAPMGLSLEMTDEKKVILSLKSSTKKLKGITNDDVWVSLVSLQKLLSGEIDQGEIEGIHKDEMLCVEPKVGMARDGLSRKAKKHFVYEMDMLRFREGYSFYIHINHTDEEPLQRKVTLGAEQKLWTMTPFSPARGLESNNMTDEAVQVILFTPMLLDQDPVCYLREHGLTLESVRADSLQILGGWDMGIHGPKPRQHMLPAGSVLSCRNEDQKEIDPFIHIGSTDMCKQGFGWALVVPYDNERSKSR